MQLISLSAVRESRFCCGGQSGKGAKPSLVHPLNCPGIHGKSAHSFYRVISSSVSVDGWMSTDNVLNNASTKRPTNPTSTHTRTLDSGLKPRSSTSGPQRGIAAPMRCLRPSLSVSFDLSLSPVASRQLTPNYLCFPKRSPSQNQRVIPTSVSLYSSMHRH